MTIKCVMRYDPTQKKLRLFRFLWRHGTPGLPGGGYSAKMSRVDGPAHLRVGTRMARVAHHIEPERRFTT